MWKNERDGDRFARCAGVAQQHVQHLPHFFNLAFRFVPESQTHGRAQTGNNLTGKTTEHLTSCILFSLMCLQTKGQETVMKRNMLARFSKTSDSPECHDNLSEFEPIERRLCLDLIWWHKLTHTIRTTNMGEYVYVYSRPVNSRLFSMSDLKWRPIHELLFHYV